VKTDQRSGITGDPNQYSEDAQYIVRLVGQVTRVSAETVAIVSALPELRFGW
jgi:predicted helicase